jgi:hypothetical protein
MSVLFFSLSLFGFYVFLSLSLSITLLLIKIGNNVIEDIKNCATPQKCFFFFLSLKAICFQVLVGTLKLLLNMTTNS